tara:strand:+ start:222 stop:356 length:135 start_codon:yes stop_codon:yes gene_type:complete
MGDLLKVLKTALMTSAVAICLFVAPVFATIIKGLITVTSIVFGV